MTSTQSTTTTKTKHYYLRAVAALVALTVAAGALAEQAKPAQAAFPGDNGKVAFESNRSGNAEIYAMKPKPEGRKNRPKNLTNNAASDMQPTVSPDGKKIAFVSTRDGVLNPEIYVMNADGTGQTRLTNNPAEDKDPTWSQDGTKIAFTTKRDGNYEIYTMDAKDGANPTNVTKNPARDMDPAWSPGGGFIAFDSNRNGNAEIYVMFSNGSFPFNITKNPAGDFGVTWSPDGQKLAFTSTRDGGNYEVYSTSFDGSNQTNLTKSAATTETEPSYSPDGTKVSFTTDRDGNENIYSMNALDGSTPKQLTKNAGSDTDPDWGVVPS